MSKGLTATLITLLSVLAIGIVVALVLLLKTEFKFDFTNIEANSLSKKLVEEKEINDIKDLDISNGVADIIIEGLQSSFNSLDSSAVCVNCNPLNSSGSMK